MPRRSWPGLVVVVLGAAGVLGLVGACGYDWTVVPKKVDKVDGTGGTKPSGSGGGGECKTSKDCGETEYCEFLDRLCGKKGAGRCSPRPPSETCEGAASAPVCGCDGKVHDTRCALNAAGIDLGLKACVVPAGSFPCGYAVCSNNEYCVTHGDEHECAPFRCTTPSCDCKEVVAECGGGSCRVVEDQVYVQCP